MKRKIEFRGKSKLNKEWLFGDLLRLGGNRTPCIFSDKDSIRYFNTDNSVVIPETIGQFTNLRDKNGVEIYEGHIVEVEEKEYQYNEVITNKYQAAVVFREGCFKLVEENGLMDMVYNKAYKCKVIGNIHDKENK